MKSFQAAVRVEDRIVIELDPLIAKTAKVENGSLFKQVLTDQGILLQLADADDVENEDVGPARGGKSPTSARDSVGANV